MGTLGGYHTIQEVFFRNWLNPSLRRLLKLSKYLSFTPDAMVLFNVLLQIQVEIMQFGSKRHHDEAQAFESVHPWGISLR